MTNRGLVGPVLTLLTRLLSACVDPALTKWKPVFKNGIIDLPQAFNDVPIKLNQLVSVDAMSDCQLRFQDHPVSL